jgi:mucolipin
MMLGTGNLLVWIGLLRYLGFFKTYNVLILTMKGAAPNIIRFLICAAMVYIGFVFAGWAILGPYSFKLASLMSTSECLFSLINGDDMYATFNFIHFDQSPSVWIYSRVYLYSFICLFIYLVLSLFISIIMDTYEIIKIGYNYGFQPSRYRVSRTNLKFYFLVSDWSSSIPLEILSTLLVFSVVSPLWTVSLVSLGRFFLGFEILLGNI